MAGRDTQTKLKRLAGRMRAAGHDRLAVCLALTGFREPLPLPEFEYAEALLEGISDEARLYWIGALYSLLLGPEQRKRQAAYFTPPVLAARLIAMAEDHGCDLRKATVFDPAAGGAAFLATVAARMRALGRDPESCAASLRGVELDPDLAVLSRSLIGKTLGLELPARGGPIRCGDALKTPIEQRADLVLANPPFGRRMGPDLDGVRWRRVASPGHVNIYALFVALALRWAKPGGLVGLIIPASFIGGPYYDRLRSHIRRWSDVLALGMVDERDDLFLDVAQDVCLLLLRKSEAGHRPDAEVKFGEVDFAGRWVDTGHRCLPKELAAAWELPPRTDDSLPGGATLADYGVAVQVGYYVWNRERERLREAPEQNAAPLYWACNIRPGQLCFPRARKRDGVDYVSFKKPSAAVILGPAVLLQRVTNSKQPRRLVAGMAPDLPGGFTTENHVILLRPIRPDVDLNLVCRLLNTKAADDRYRRLSGTASLSAKLLRRLDLPDPARFRAALVRNPDVEQAAAEAYGREPKQHRSAA
jgi:adenine-specific DNA-methyltransferase